MYASRYSASLNINIRGLSIQTKSTKKGEEHDYDMVNYSEDYHVFEEREIPPPYRHSFLIIKEFTTPAGYVKLVYDMILNSTYNPSMSAEEMFIHQCCKVDKYGRILLHEIIKRPEESSFMSFTKNKPAVKTKNYYATSVDNNIACRCKTWPSFAQEWISRDRLFGWPTKSMVQQLSSLGFFVVKKGHPLSPEKDLEWRASFSLQERELMFSLTDVQHKCYTVLKIFNRELVKSNCITSYHWKTCLFYVIEQNSEDIWKKEKLFVCIQICILQMLAWVISEFCPNYFIPRDNLFAGTLNKSQKYILEDKFEELLKDGFNCLLNVKVGNICDYYWTRASLEDFQMLQLNSEHELKKALYMSWTWKITATLDRFNKRILDQYYYIANENVLLFIRYLWRTLQRIIYYNTTFNTITEHTSEETRNALSSLLPHIYSCLASNIAAIAIQITNRKVHDFLLFGSFTYFMKGNLSGKLKFISVLYAIGLIEDCEWYINQIDEEYIKHAPSSCACRAVNKYLLQDYMNSITQLEVPTCISFLSSELLITPNALKYEMFRSFGISVTKNERSHPACQWHYRVVVDCNIYFLFLKYLIKIKPSGGIKGLEYIMGEFVLLLSRQQVRHCDVALNVLAWMTTSDFRQYHTALILLTTSWDFTNSLNLEHLITTEELKQKQYQFNAAKLHALVVLYKTWFKRNSSSNIFCFHCYLEEEHNLKKCSRCKISTYCSKQCQENDWKMHKSVCKIFKTCHNI